MNAYPSIPRKVGRRKEVEVKLRVAPERVGAVKRLLRQLGAQRLGRVHEMNTLYDTPRGRFRKRGYLLRLRVTGRRGKAGGSAGLLTYKGPGARSRRYKVREEIEVQIAEPERLRAILDAVGLVPAFRYEKFRTSYQLPAAAGAPGVAVELDETPIGTFLELEGSPRAIDRAAKLLGYGPADYITLSYLALYLETCRLSRVRQNSGGSRERQGRRPRGMLFR